MLVSRDLEYLDGTMTCIGHIAYDDEEFNPRPAVLIAPDWGGRGDSACEKARQLASMGYVGFAIDMYGKAQLGHDKTENRALMTPLMQNRDLLANRINAAFKALSQLPQVNQEKIAAIGYCFGGLCVLDLARSGAPVQAVVSFHGLLTAPDQSLNTPISSKILILHGYDDPLVKPEQIDEFSLEMTERNADWQVHLYGLTQHSFTNPQANDDEMGLHYNQTADHRSWLSTTNFLQEAFSQ